MNSGCLKKIVPAVVMSPLSLLALDIWIWRLYSVKTSFVGVWFIHDPGDVVPRHTRMPKTNCSRDSIIAILGDRNCVKLCSSIISEIFFGFWVVDAAHGINVGCWGSGVSNNFWRNWRASFSHNAWFSEKAWKFSDDGFHLIVIRMVPSLIGMYGRVFVFIVDCVEMPDCERCAPVVWGTF